MNSPSESQQEQNNQPESGAEPVEAAQVAGERDGRGRRGDRGHRRSPDGHRGHGGPRGGGRRRGSRRSKGDVRSALLILIAEQPRHGYELMQAIGDRTDGNWQPSPGSVYPALQLLQDEGLIRIQTDDGGRGVASLSPDGQSYLDANRDRLETVWDDVRGTTGTSQRELAVAFKSVVLAYRQVAAVGTSGQAAAAAAVLNDAQRALYGVLAEPPSGDLDD